LTGTRIFVFSELYWPEVTSTGHFLTGIAEGLARRWPVTAICAQPTYAARGTRAPQREERNGVSIRRCRSTAFPKDVLLLRLINLCTISLTLFLAAVRSLRRGDIALVVTNPPLLPYLVTLACRLRGASCLLLVHDLYPDVLVSAGVLRKDGLPARFLRGATRWLYRHTARIIVIGRDQERLVRERLGDRAAGIEYIPNWSDHEEIAPRPKAENRLLAALSLADCFVIQYSGNMGRTHGLADLLEAAELLRADPSVHFLLIGWGGRRSDVVQSIQRRGLSNVTVLPPRPRAELADSLNACDVALLAMAPGMCGVSVPSRMYNILAAGKPLIAVADGESEPAAVIREEGIGWVVPPNRPDLLAGAVREAVRNPETLAEMGRRARQAAEDRHTYTQAVTAYLRLFGDLHDGICQ
jgi:colanic acid biosynthesis glycosyl transferase WcaI